MPRYLLILALVALLVFTLIDCLRSEDEERLGLPKALWAIIIIVFVPIGPIAYLVVSRVARKDSAQRNPSTPPRPRGLQRNPRPGPVAPDDDPEFLAKLDEQVRRNQSDDRHGPRDENDSTS